MKFVLIVFIVSACGLSVSGLTCYVCGTNVDPSVKGPTGSIKRCSGSNSEKQDCSTKPDIFDKAAEMSCYLTSGGKGKSELRGCATKDDCLVQQQKPGMIKADVVKCCYSDFCNSDSFRPPAAKEQLGGANRITVCWKLLLSVLVLPMLLTMYINQ